MEVCREFNLSPFDLDRMEDVEVAKLRNHLEIVRQVEASKEKQRLELDIKVWNERFAALARATR